MSSESEIEYTKEIFFSYMTINLGWIFGDYVLTYQIFKLVFSK